MRSADHAPSATRWHAIGLAGYVVLLGIYVAAAARMGVADDTRLRWILCTATLSAGVCAFVGWLRGWQRYRTLLFAWPLAALVVTISVGVAEPGVTRALPGTITITFAFVGLTCRRWRSLAILPLGCAAWIVSSGKGLHGVSLTLAAAMVMWVLIAETPAWLISRLEQQSVLLREIAQTDPLTRLLNRSTLDRHLSTHAGRTALVLIDLDDFKRYNDSHGHDAGDQLLTAFGEALRWSVRREDVAFRVGGDEFVLLLAGGDRAAAEQVVDRLRQRWADTGAPVGFSAGISCGEQELLRSADQEMYAAKRSRDRP